MAWWRNILGLAMGGSGAIEYKKDANIFSDYNLCSSVPIEKITAQLTSAYNLCVPQEEYLTATLASAYNLESLNPNPDVNLTAIPTSVYVLSTEETPEP